MDEISDSLSLDGGGVSKFAGDELSDAISDNMYESISDGEMVSKFVGDELSSDEIPSKTDYNGLQEQSLSKFAGDDFGEEDESVILTSNIDRNEEHPNDEEPTSIKNLKETVRDPDCKIDIAYNFGKDRTSDDFRWQRILSSIGVHKEAHDLVPIDIIGRVFNCLEDAEFFFCHFAKLTGFSVRKGHMRRRKNGILMLREWKCSREGKRDEKFLKLVNRRREARPITRVGCKVQLRVVHLNDNQRWIAKEFIVEHNHKLVDASHVQFLRSNRVVSGGDLQLARSMRSAGIRTCHIMSFMAQQSGGYENMRYIIKDLYNNIHASEGIQLSDGDASRAMGYLEHKMDHDEGFFAKYSYDNEGRLGNVVWCDSRCQADFSCFGHAIAFDTTYRTNGYRKPLLIWIGVNQHFKTTVLGFAILIDETVETYLWVTKAFIECMKGVIPKSVVTDGDPAIRVAVAKLMPNARHRLCSWHIQRNAITNVKDPDFLPRMKRMIYKYYSNDVFEKEWTRMVSDFGLQNNTWIKVMYEKRKTWAETFLRGVFFVGMATTQRSEGINALLKKKLTEKLNLFQFVRSIDLALSSLRHTEVKDEFDTYNSKPMLNQTNMKEVESQVAEIYSRAIFFKVRDEIAKEGKYIVTAKGSDNDEIYYELTKYGEKECKRKVWYNNEKDYYDCGCNYFPTFGIPCRHVFTTLKYRHVTCIPQSMIVSQWTMDAKKKLLKESTYAPKCRYTCSEETARFGVVESCSRNIAFVAGKNERLFELAVSEMSRVNNLLLNEMDTNFNIHNDRLKLLKKGVQIRNPLHTKTKGTSSAKGGRGGGKRKCSKCNKYGHNKTTCKNRNSNKHKNDDTMELDEEIVNLGEDSFGSFKIRADFPEFDHYKHKTEAPNVSRTCCNSEGGWKNFEEQQSSEEDTNLSLSFNTSLNDAEYQKWWGNPFD